MKFQLGDLIVAMTERIGYPGLRREMMVRFAEEVGVPVQRLERYRRVAAAWPPDKRHPEVSWTVHEILVPYADRFKILKRPPKVRLSPGQGWTGSAALIETRGWPAVRDSLARREAAKVQQRSTATRPSSSDHEHPLNL